MAMRLTDEQLAWLAARVPEAPVNPKGGRPAMDKRQALRGIFWILDNGAKWKDLPRRFGSKSSVHKYFTLWTRACVFESIMRDARRLVEVRGGYKLYECFIDATFSKAEGGGDGTLSEMSDIVFGLPNLGAGQRRTAVFEFDDEDLPIPLTSLFAS